MAKYLDLISKSKDAKEKEALEGAAEDAAFQISLDISAAKKAVRTAEKEVEAAVTSIPFNSEDVLQAKRDLAAATEDLTALEELKTEYFG